MLTASIARRTRNESSVATRLSDHHSRLLNIETAESIIKKATLHGIAEAVYIVIVPHTKQ